MKAHLDSHGWAVKNLAGECLDKFESHSAAVAAIDAHQADPAAYPAWAVDLRIIRVPAAASPIPPYRCQADSPKPGMSAQTFPIIARTLLYCGSTLGFGHPYDECYFRIRQNGQKRDWTIAETLARIYEFSPAAQTRIWQDCADQLADDLAGIKDGGAN